MQNAMAVEDPDVLLMQRIAREDRTAFEELIARYQKKVLNTIYRYLGNPSVAEELSQEAFIRVYRAAATYQPDAKFSTWLFTIVRNLCMNYRTRQGRHDHQMESDAEPALQLIHPRANPEQEMVRKERDLKIQQAISELPESLRLPLVLHHFSQLPYDEIAKTLDISLAAVKVRIHRAKLGLLEKLKTEDL